MNQEEAITYLLSLDNLDELNQMTRAQLNELFIAVYDRGIPSYCKRKEDIIDQFRAMVRGVKRADAFNNLL